MPRQALTSRCACTVGRYPQSVAYEASPNFSMSFSSSPCIPADRIGASQVVSMQETGDTDRVGSTPDLLSKTLSSNDAQLGTVIALLWTPLLCGEQTDRCPGAHARLPNAQPGSNILLCEDG